MNAVDDRALRWKEYSELANGLFTGVVMLTCVALSLGVTIDTLPKMSFAFALFASTRLMAERYQMMKRFLKPLRGLQQHADVNLSQIEQVYNAMHQKFWDFEIPGQLKPSAVATASSR